MSDFFDWTINKCWFKATNKLVIFEVQKNSMQFCVGSVDEKWEKRSGA